MGEPDTMRQVAPYPHTLAALVSRLRYREHMGWEVQLEDDLQRDKPGRHIGESRGLTLVVTRCGPDTHHPERVIAVNHYFPVPPATYNEASWQRWLFDRLGDVDTHERMEDFALADPAVCDHERLVPSRPCRECQERVTRPYAPVHKPGHDPYMVAELTTDLDRRTSFRGEVNPP